MSERAPVGRADRGERSATNRYKTSSFVGVLFITSLLSPTTLARDVDCVGQLGSRSIDGNLNVAVPCRLDGTTVKGNVRVFAGGSLIADRARIEGNLHARNADFVVLIETLVKGNVHLEQLVGDRSRIDFSDVDGNTRLTRNRTRLELQDGRFDGNVQVEENSGGVLILRNRIDGKLTCRRNDPAPVGSGNRVSGRSSDQCARLSAEGAAAPTPPPPPPPPPSNDGSSGPSPPADSSPPTPAPPQPAPPASGGGSGGSGSGGSGSGPTEPVLNPQPSGGGAAVGPLDLLAVIVLLALLPFRRAR